jgi:tRNA A37 threonylcarbamoyladenosine dehydratase
MADLHPRYIGIVRLFGAAGLARLRAARVCVVGVGGVGSWLVEALARTGVGALTLIDLDDVCASNLNRQLHALENTVGRPKVAVMTERCAAINPDCQVTAVQEFLTADNGGRLLGGFTDGAVPGTAWVVDALDDVTNKVHLLAQCRARGLPVVCCGGAGGRSDPRSLRLADLAEVSHDRLLGEVRRRLRREHGWPPEGQPIGLPCVYSTERPVFPRPDGTICHVRDMSEGARLNCDWGLGSATFVTGTFGFMAAGWVTHAIVTGAEPKPGARRPKRPARSKPEA